MYGISNLPTWVDVEYAVNHSIGKLSNEINMQGTDGPD